MKTTHEEELERYEYFYSKKSELAWDELSEAEKVKLTEYCNK